LDSKANLASSSNRIDATLIGTGIISNAEFNHLEGIAQNIETALNSKQSTLSNQNRLDPYFIGLGSVGPAELNHLSGVTDFIQLQPNRKQFILEPSDSIALKNYLQLEVIPASQGRYTLDHRIGPPNNTWYLICKINVGEDFDKGKHIGMELIGANEYNVSPSVNKSWRLFMNFLVSNGSGFKNSSDTMHEVRGQVFADLACYVLSNDGKGPRENRSSTDDWSLADQWKD
jgi:hypothetical protein